MLNVLDRLLHTRVYVYDANVIVLFSQINESILTKTLEMKCFLMQMQPCKTSDVMLHSQLAALSS